MAEYISKEKAIKELREVYENEYPTASGDFDEYASHDMPNVLRNIPAADVQPVKRGHWIEVTPKHSQCSCCEVTCLIAVYPISAHANFCPNCGAKMLEKPNLPADVQPIVYAHKTINVGRRSYCSNCGKLAIMEDFCSKCGAKVKDGEPTRNLTDEETEIYESWIDHEAKDTGVNIMDGDT